MATVAILLAGASIGLACSALTPQESTLRQGAAQFRALARSQAEALLPVLEETVKREGDSQAGKPQFALTGGGAVEVRTGNALHVVAPVMIRYTAIPTVNCRLAVYTTDRKEANFVPLPLNADYDSCRGMDQLGIADVNHDGVPDFIYKVNIPSNKTDEIVWEGAVYLSKPDPKAPYCFAPDISRTVTLYKPPTAIDAFIAAEVNRRGTRVLNCYGASQ
ncbi:MAG TPA: hypothetical protein VFA65_16020 [Bryobacteraceae bacterium]|nr:hypothetical protein [Bryobacteraceae bacterium]